MAKFQIGVMTDLHYYAQENIDDKDKCTEVCEQTISTSHLADAILKTALDFYKVQAEQGKLEYLHKSGTFRRLCVSGCLRL